MVVIDSRGRERQKREFRRLDEGIEWDSRREGDRGNFGFFIGFGWKSSMDNFRFPRNFHSYPWILKSF